MPRLELTPMPSGVYYLNNPDPKGRVFVYVVDEDGAIVDGPRPVDPGEVEHEVADLRAGLRAGIDESDLEQAEVAS